MLLSLSLPIINPFMTTATIEVLHVSVGDFLPLGSKLMDLKVDLSAAAPQDCPPIASFRLAVRDAVYLRRLDVIQGQEYPVGASLALFSTTPDEPLDAEPTRALRLSTAGIMQAFSWDEV